MSVAGSKKKNGFLITIIFGHDFLEYYCEKVPKANKDKDRDQLVNQLVFQISCMTTKKRKVKRQARSLKFPSNQAYENLANVPNSQDHCFH